MENKRMSVVIRLLLPIARICIRFRIPVQEVYEGLRVAFVEEASRNLDRNEEKKTVSRLSIITGLDRPTVKRIFRENITSEIETPIASKIVGHWLNDSRYRSKMGTPRSLTIGTDDCEFAQLVKQVTKNYSPGTMLQELIVQQVAKVSGNRVKLIANAVDYQFDEDRLLQLYTRNAESLSRAYSENVEKEDNDRNVHVRTEYDNIYVSQIPQIRQWLLREAANFHKRIRDYLTQFDADLAPDGCNGQTGGKVVIGSFSTTSEGNK